MLKELLSIFRPGNPLAEVADSFAQMLDMAYEVTVRAGNVYFGESVSPEERTAIYKQDVKINKLERSIRKRVIAHLSIQGSTPDLPYCLLLISLVKDVERIGDYAKNLAEVRELRPAPLPADEVFAEIKEIREGVEGTFKATSEVFIQSRRDAAIDLIGQGRDLAHRSDALLTRVAQGGDGYDSGTTAAAVLGTRYYKRIGGHVLNILSAVVMPLHKLDYYDERELGEGEQS